MYYRILIMSTSIIPNYVVSQYKNYEPCTYYFIIKCRNIYFK